MDRSSTGSGYGWTISRGAALRRRSPDLTFPVQHVDEQPQPAELAAVEAEAQPRQRRQVRIARFRRQGAGLLDGAAHDDVLELRAQPLQHFRLQAMLQAQ